MDIDDDWENFLHQDINEYSCDDGSNKEQQVNELLVLKREKDIKSTPIYISTTTKIAYLNTSIDIYNLFWDVPIINYDNHENGIIKKQIKLTTYNKDDDDIIIENLKKYKFTKKHTISLLDNPTSKAKINYKHVQKISVGISKKDFINYRTKEKGAFYNCFALVFRVLFEDEYKEVHVKVFNTGKLEIPGIKNIKLLYITLKSLVKTLNSIIKENIEFIKDSVETVLINSNFNCGFYVNRDKLYELLKFKYNMISMYDPCSYPGIQSKFYYNKNKYLQNGVCECKTKCNKKGNGDGKGECHEVSFMIFRTGSVLIVGRCDEEVLYEIYDFLKKIFDEEFTNIFESLPPNKPNKNIVKKSKKIQLIIPC
jgi:TATA-box binding protein (TBP) (component of TFIID and TFIIIB)